MRYSYPLIKWWRRKEFKSGPCLLPAGVIGRGAGEKDNLSVLDASIEYRVSGIENRVSNRESGPVRNRPFSRLSHFCGISNGTSLFFLPVLHYELSPKLVNAGF